LAGEINLCGHAAMASSFVIFNFFEKNTTEIVFTTLSGDLVIHRVGNRFETEFPSFPLKEIPVSEKIVDAIGMRPKETRLIVFPARLHQSAIRRRIPYAEGVIATLYHVLRTRCLRRILAHGFLPDAETGMRRYNIWRYYTILVKTLAKE